MKPTRDEIIELLREAAEAGDLNMVELCSYALYGPASKLRDKAIATCALVIALAQAQEEETE